MIKNMGIFKIDRYALLLLCTLFFQSGFSQVGIFPTANIDIATADQNTTLNVPFAGDPDNYANLLDNDIEDPNGTHADLFITRFSVDGGATWINVGNTGNMAGVGTITINADGTYTFIPANNYSGYVPGGAFPDSQGVLYEIEDADGDTTISALFLTVETNGGIIEISGIASCNQGYTTDGKYKIQYAITIHNKSITRGEHDNSEISNIQLFDDLEAIFGDTCIFRIDNKGMYTENVAGFLVYTRPLEWDNSNFNNNEFTEDNATPGNDGIFSTSSSKLYPNQRINLTFCLLVNPDCGGRVVPTMSGSGYAFDNILTVTSDRGSDTDNLELTDFHTPETTVSANFYVPEETPVVNFDGTYDYSNTVIITNDGTAQANNVNYNMGLQNFINNGVSFIFGDHDNDTATPEVQTPVVIQVDNAGNPITTLTVNSNYDGINNTKLLDPNQVLASGETIYLKIYHKIGTIIQTNNSSFFNPDLSMTQGAADGFDETINQREKYYSYVVWDDANGSHLDRYYLGANIDDVPSSDDQCLCVQASMRFEFSMTLSVDKTIVANSLVPAQDNILEHKEITFNIRVRNEATSNVRVTDVTLTDNLLGICGGNILNILDVSLIIPTDAADIPEEVPNLNAAYNGNTDVNIFDGASGILNPGEFLDVRIKIEIEDDCIGNNSAVFFGDVPLSVGTPVVSSVPVSIFTDTDNDGVSNVNDIDDDNDGIPDLLEYNGVDPLSDADNDNIPNYRDVGAGALDINNDGIVDAFDFDMDGVPNHFDLDSDNDGILDIVEAGNGVLDTSGNGRTNNPVGFNGLDNSLENVDNGAANIIYTIPNNDTDANLNYLDIDSDGDGIVDNIEAQTSANYLSIAATVDALTGINTAYPNGLTPVDTDSNSLVPDGIPDYLDADSDDDARSDIIEGWDFNNNGVIDGAEIAAINSDSDSDGLDDAYDNDDTQINPKNNQSPLVIGDFPNVDNDITPELDWRERPAIIVIINPDFTVTEGDGNNLEFTLKLVALSDISIPKTSGTDIVINIFTSDGTTTTTTYDVAKAPFDYDEILNTPTVITIPAGDTEVTVSIPVNDDIIDELEERMTLNCLITSANTINTATNPPTGLYEANIALTSIGIIIDNDNAPDITMVGDTQNEGVDLVPTITLSHPSSRPIVIDLITSDGTAIAGADLDYISFTNTVTINGTDDDANPNLTVNSNDLHITTNLDNLNEPLNENLHIVGTVTSNNVGISDLDKLGVIIDVDPEPTMSISSPEVVEGNVLVFEVSLDFRNFNDVNIDVFTNDNTARSPDDFTAIAFTQITIPATEQSTTVSVTTIDDLLVEDLENLVLHGRVTSFNTQNFTAEGTGTIIDNDLPNLFSPNGDGLSDVYEVISLMQYLNFKMQIFDRWGSIVYDYSNNNNPQPVWWDGTLNSKPVPEGVYYYTVDYNDGVTQAKSGFIQLIR